MKAFNEAHAELTDRLKDRHTNPISPEEYDRLELKFLSEVAHSVRASVAYSGEPNNAGNMRKDFSLNSSFSNTMAIVHSRVPLILVPLALTAIHEMGVGPDDGSWGKAPSDTAVSAFVNLVAVGVYEAVRQLAIVGQDRLSGDKSAQMAERMDHRRNQSDVYISQTTFKSNRSCTQGLAAIDTPRRPARLITTAGSVAAGIGAGGLHSIPTLQPTARARPANGCLPVGMPKSETRTPNDKPPCRLATLL